MAKNLASVKPVKCYGYEYDGQLIEQSWRHKTGDFNTPCTLLTTARYKHMAGALKKAQKMLALYDDQDSLKLERIAAMQEFSKAIEAAEKAGVLKNI